MMTATELAVRLSERAEAVAAHLLPGGKRVGQEWRCGNVLGDAGRSLGVHLSGTKAGVWSDFASGESGRDLIGLWMLTRGVGLHAACEEARHYLGIRPERWERPAKTYNRPDTKGFKLLQAEHAAWLRDVRKLPDATVRAFKVRTSQGAIAFPYLRDKQLVQVKYRKAPAKEFYTVSGAEPCLFGWHVVPPHVREIILCEGELDAMAWHAYGFTALSVPFGGGTGAKQAWIESEFDRLAVYDTLFLNLDADTVGRDAMREMTARLGLTRCRTVTLPYKDANECLMNGVDVADMARALQDAPWNDPPELINVADLEDEVLALGMRGDFGIELPWKKMRADVKLRMGEVSVWAGYNGHGKSAVLSQVIAHAINDDWLACIASLEYTPAEFVDRFTRMISGTPTPTQVYRVQIMRELRDRCWLLDTARALTIERIIEVFTYARRRYGISFFVLDNLSKVGVDEDDYATQKRMVEKLFLAARGMDAHIAVVCHMRKDRDEDRPGGKMGIKGSGSITDLVHTVIEVWRNKPAERRKSKGEVLPPHESFSTLLRVLKQRHNGHEPSFKLWFNEETMQFLSAPEHVPRPMLRPPVRPAPDSGDQDHD